MGYENVGHHRDRSAVNVVGIIIKVNDSNTIAKYRVATLFGENFKDFANTLTIFFKPITPQFSPCETVITASHIISRG